MLSRVYERTVLYYMTQVPYLSKQLDDSTALIDIG